MISERNRQIVNAIKRSNLNEYENLYNLYQIVLNIFEECFESLEDSIQREDKTDLKYLLKIAKYIKGQSLYRLRETGNLDYESLYWKVMLFEAPHLFESFMLYMEKNRPLNERFYEPRRNPLERVAEAIQELADDLLDEIFINMPGRVGKTQIVKFAFTWWGARNSELSNLYTAYSDKITAGFYTGISELITDPTYTFKEIFRNTKIVKKDGQDEIIDLDRIKTYPSYTCRSIYGTLNGACDCNGLGVTDDLFSGIEEAINIDRQVTVWGKYDNNFIPRLKRKAKLINMGTRWAPLDCQGRRMELLKYDKEYADRRYKEIIIPALDDNEESNFDYPYNLGYSTADYKMRRASFERNDDLHSWYAQYQQTPTERLGSLFENSTTNFFNPNTDLPDRKPDRIFMAVDEAFGGGDFVSAPICYQYDETYYIMDVVFNNGDKKITRPLIVEKILKHQIQAARFEETKTTSDYREWIIEELKKLNYRANLYGEPAPGKLGKRNRILDKAPEIREMYFLDSEFQEKEYRNFMNNIYQFRREGNVKHDDAPDSMGQLCEMKYSVVSVAEPAPRLF